MVLSVKDCSMYTRDNRKSGSGQLSCTFAQFSGGFRRGNNFENTDS